MDCNSCEGCTGCRGGSAEVALSMSQAQILSRFAQTPFLPLAQITPPEGESWLAAGFEAGRETGTALRELAGLGLLSLDFDLPLTNYDYLPYEGLCPGGSLRRGSAALTPLGQAVLEQVQRLL